MITDSAILIWKIPWTEEPGRLQSMGSQGVEHDLATKEQRPKVKRKKQRRKKRRKEGRRKGGRKKERKETFFNLCEFTNSLEKKKRVRLVMVKAVVVTNAQMKFRASLDTSASPRTAFMTSSPSPISGFRETNSSRLKEKNDKM